MVVLYGMQSSGVGVEGRMNTGEDEEARWVDPGGWFNERAEKDDQSNCPTLERILKRKIGLFSHSANIINTRFF